MSIGYPDFQSYAQWRGPNLLAGYTQTLNPGHNRSGPQLMVNYRAAQVRVVPSAQGGAVTLSWFADSAETIPTGSDNWHVNASTGLNVIVPTKGAYCDLDINVTTGAAMTVSTQLHGTNAGSGQVDYPVTGNLLNTGTVSVPLSGSSLTPLPFVQAGLAKVSFLPLDGSAKLTLAIAVINADGTFNSQLANYAQPINPVNDLVGLTDDICGLYVLNTDATAAHSYIGRITAGLGH